MPLPVPKEGEKMHEFVSRCISFQTREENEKPKTERRPPAQIEAMCFEQWRRHKK